MTLDDTELRELVDELTAQWKEFGAPRPLHQPAARKGRRFLGSDLSRITAVYGLARHVHETAPAIKLLIDSGHTNQAIPLVRLAYESALTAAWLVQSKEQHGIRAFLHEYNRSRAALRNDALEAASATFRYAAADIVDAAPLAFAGSHDNLRRFQDVCLDLTPGGKDAFIYYRILSSYCHASADVADLYFEPSPAGDSMAAYRNARDALGKPILLFLTAASMVWSARAFSYLSQDRQHRSQIRRAALALGVQADLQLSDQYHLRHIKRRPQGD